MNGTTGAKDAELKSEAVAIRTAADACVIASHDDYLAVATKLTGIKGLMKKAIEFFKPMKQAADAAKKAILDNEKSVVEPLTYAEGIYKRRMAAWDTDQEAIRKKEEERLREVARIEAENRQLNEAAEVEKMGDHETAQAILEQPVQAPVVVVQSETPKAAGISYTERWKFRIVDAAKVPREYLAVDETKIGAVVRAMKSAIAIPGIEIYSEKTVSAKG